MKEKLITNLINLGAEIANHPDKDKAISWLKIWELDSPDTEALVELLCSKYKENNKFSCKLFYWNPAEGWKVYHRLQEAAKDMQYRGKPLKFCSYCTIEDKNPIWIAQTRADEYGCTLQIWQVDENYYICIG